MSLTLREIKLLKQRRKKSGPPCCVDFKRELTSSVLTSRGFHCSKSFLDWRQLTGSSFDLSVINTTKKTCAFFPQATAEANNLAAVANSKALYNKKMEEVSLL